MYMDNTGQANNRLNPGNQSMYHQVQHLKKKVYSTKRVFRCSVWMLENKAIISLDRINSFVYCAV